MMLFINDYLLGLTQWQCSDRAGMNYSTTAVDWGSFMREAFKEYVVWSEQEQIILSSLIERR